jgi:sugar phosphate isomerase/epimerase
MRPADGRSDIVSSHPCIGRPPSTWDFVSTGLGDVPSEDAFRAVRAVACTGSISVEWKDAGMDRQSWAAEAMNFVRGLLWGRPQSSFDSAFSSQ